MIGHQAIHKRIGTRLNVLGVELQEAPIVFIARKQIFTIVTAIKKVIVQTTLQRRWAGHGDEYKCANKSSARLTDRP